MKTTKLFHFGSMALLIAVGSLSSCEKEVAIESANDQKVTKGRPDTQGFADNNMVMYWNEKANTVIDGPGTPPSQARHTAMIAIAVHDALNSIKPKFETHALKNCRDKNANPDAAVASAAYWTIKNIKMQGTHPIDDWYAESLSTIPDGAGKELGLALGKKSADAITAKRNTDNFALANEQAHADDGVAPGEYRSTLPFSNPGMPRIKALQKWGTLMTPFVVKSNDQFRPSAPYPVNSAEYLADYNEVKNKGGRASHNRTADEDEIGKFWVERSTIGWNRLARGIIASKKMDAWRTARVFALMHTAMADAISGCFEAKYHYLYWRPETAIRLGDDDGNPNTVGDVSWLPSYTESPNLLNPAMNVNTPPLPDYPSAHASFGGAGAEILKLFFETDNISVDLTSPTTPGVTRHYSKLSQAAKDNSLSRIYVGFHFRYAVLKGETMGRQVASYVFANSFKETGEDD